MSWKQTGGCAVTEIANDPTLAPYASTLQHIAMISEKLASVAEKLMEAKREAQCQLVQRIASDYAAGRLTRRQLCAAYDAYRTTSGTGFSETWNAALPFSATQMQHMKARFRREDRCAVSQWSGEFPFDEIEATPPNDFSVVYVLFDQGNQPCYVGSTKNFRSRVRRHAKDGKCFAHWTAYPCGSRESAYQLEERLLRERLPYLNKKVTR
jgi:GIY-YIG catalytic domain